MVETPQAAAISFNCIFIKIILVKKVYVSANITLEANNFKFFFQKKAKKSPLPQTGQRGAKGSFFV